jgi:hypothetical protein
VLQRQRLRIACRHFGERRCGWIPSLGQDAIDGVAAGENADKSDVAVGHQNYANLTLPHLPRGFHNRRGRR